MDERRGRWIVGLALSAALTVVPQLTWAAGPAPPQPDYHPSLGDLMTTAVQPRHAKLGLSARARNWSYAAYEASELRNAFNRIARTIPSYRDTDLQDMFAANVKTPLDDIDAAIKARSGPRFDAAYGRLTQACNLCHEGLGHGFVVIRQPSASSFPDQAFSPR